MTSIKKFIRSAFRDADLMQGFVDKAYGQVDRLNRLDKRRLYHALQFARPCSFTPKSAEEAAAIAVLKFIVDEVVKD